MGPHILSGDRLRRWFLLSSFAICATYAQTTPVSGHCAVTAVPAQVRAEGLAERLGDILLQCSGSNPGSVLSGNLQVFLPVGISNRVNTSNQTTDAVLSVDYGHGFVPTGVPGLISGQIIAFNGLSITTPPSGNVTIKISNIRAAVYQLGAAIPQQVLAQISFSSPASIAVDQSRLPVAYSQPGVLVTLYNRGNITCAGSALPDSPTMAGFFAAKTFFASTRVTEGFAASFQPRGPGDDTGTRFLVRYAGFPTNARVFLPDYVAGSSASTPTSGGDLGLPQQPGTYVPGSNTLLLARVQFPNPDGSGGLPVSAPTGSASITFNSASEVPLSGGSGFAVYEVVDANPNLQETAQFPTFIGLGDVTAPAVAQESISFAPVSTVLTASPTAPIPRFAAAPAVSDCNALGDCNGPYFPKLQVLALPVNLAAVAGGAVYTNPNFGYIAIDNAGQGVMNWTARISYTKGSGWLTLDYNSGQNNGSVRVFANPQGLAPGVYTASVTIDAGGLAGNFTVPVTLTIQPPPTLPSTGSNPTTTPSTPSNPTAPTNPTTPPVSTGPSVAVTKVVNAATFETTPLVAGSLATVMGQNLSGKAVAVTFDGIAADLLYMGASQINLRVPASLASKTSSTLVVTVDGVSSAPQVVPLTAAWPAIFANGVLNQDYSANAPGSAAARESVLQIFATGIPAGAIVSAQIGTRRDLVPLYTGDAPDVPGVQQVNVAVPADAAGPSTSLALCVTTPAQQYCSTAYPLAIQQ
jgi:uncharacterized protein (TIGR03437 family)